MDIILKIKNAFDTNYLIIFIFLGGVLSLLEYLFPICKVSFNQSINNFKQDFLWIATTEFLNPKLLFVLSGLWWVLIYQFYYPVIKNFPVLNFTPHIIFFFLAREFTFYWMHRSLHSNKFLWSLHKIHHNTTSMRWMNSYREHILESIYTGFGATILLVVFKPDRTWLWLIETSNMFLGGLCHANFRIKWGPFEGFLNTTRAHWVHHEVECYKKDGQNFGALTLIWDRIFGTYHADFQGEDTKIGFKNQQNVPKSFLGQILYPIKRIFMKQYS